MTTAAKFLLWLPSFLPAKVPTLIVRTRVMSPAMMYDPDAKCNTNMEEAFCKAAVMSMVYGGPTPKTVLNCSAPCHSLPKRLCAHGYHIGLPRWFRESLLPKQREASRRVQAGAKQTSNTMVWGRGIVYRENFRIVLNLLKLLYCAHLMCCRHIESTAQEASNIPKIIISNKSVEFIFWQCIFTAKHFVWAWKFLVCQNRSVGGVKLTAKCFRSKDIEGRVASPWWTPSTHLQLI